MTQQKKDKLKGMFGTAAVGTTVAVTLNQLMSVFVFGQDYGGLKVRVDHVEKTQAEERVIFKELADSTMSHHNQLVELQYRMHAPGASPVPDHTQSPTPAFEEITSSR